jgi:hypothetical protein
MCADLQSSALDKNSSERLRVASFLYTTLGMNDSASALPFHSADDITALDDATALTAGQIPTEIAANCPKKRSSRTSSTPIGTARFCTLFLENLFLEKPDDRDITLFTTLMVAKPFATAKARAY